MSKISKIKEKIREKKIVVGSSVTFSDSCIAELLGDAGFDFVWIDMEHSCNSKKEVQQHIMAVRGTEAAAFVRVPWNAPALVKPILDIGPDGIIFPFIRNADEAKTAVDLCRYPPLGTRGFGPIRASKYGMVNRTEYLKSADTRIWKIMQIEHVDAVNNLEKILDVDGVDSIVIGLNDLSASIGLLHQPNHKEVKKLVDIICQKSIKAGRPFGVAMSYDPEHVKEWIDRGASWIELAGDFAYLLKSAKEALNGTLMLYETQKSFCRK